jgi:hypothetical protein
MTRMAWVLAVLVALGGCGDDDDRVPPGENTGRSCTAADQCYPNVEGDLQGGVAVCLAEVPGGYCTHHCSSDADCCAVPGECGTSHPQVCSPFQATGLTLCFLSCEARDVQAAGVSDGNTYCQRFAHSSFNCRSTGGGAANRQVCVP